ISIPAFISAGNQKFAYKLEGKDPDWIIRQEEANKAESILCPKRYTLHLKSRVGEKEWMEEVSFDILLVPPWYETLWFRLLAMGIFIASTIGIYRWRLGQVRQQERISASLQQKISEVEMQALRSQMNPHFLFNSLNSIQLCVIKNQTEKAVEYLSSFSHLMRLTLVNSRSRQISLKQELEALRLYMELENLRFSQMFEFHIYVEDGMHPDDYNIPPMLLQPFVENAIIHGLQNKEGKGEINIYISKEGEYLRCKIKDNGIGREAAEVLKKNSLRKHKSMGMKITADRLEMINQTEGTKARIEIEDLYDSHKIPAGTRVIVQLPI
ncbi:MAG: histidine kinase, partial [Bacteroidota bacterium]